MKYVLDTNVIIRLLKNDTIIKNNLEGITFDGDDICITAITYYEIKRGLIAINKSQSVVTFDKISNSWAHILLDKLEIFDRAAKIYNDLKAQGIEGHDADILIAAATLCLGSDTVLVTYDNDFDHIPDLKKEKW
jgi:tRNA(fMet)-specific endonuclease VapC